MAIPRTVANALIKCRAIGGWHRKSQHEQSKSASISHPRLHHVHQITHQQCNDHMCSRVRALVREGKRVPPTQDEAQNVQAG